MSSITFYKISALHVASMITKLYFPRRMYSRKISPVLFVLHGHLCMVICRCAQHKIFPWLHSRKSWRYCVSSKFFLQIRIQKIEMCIKLLFEKPMISDFHMTSFYKFFQSGVQKDLLQSRRQLSMKQKGCYADLIAISKIKCFHIYI